MHEQNAAFKKGQLMVLSQIRTKSEQRAALLCEQPMTQAEPWATLSCLDPSLSLESKLSLFPLGNVCWSMLCLVERERR